MCLHGECRISNECSSTLSAIPIHPSRFLVVYFTHSPSSFVINSTRPSSLSFLLIPPFSLLPLFLTPPTLPFFSYVPSLTSLSLSSPRPISGLAGMKSESPNVRSLVKALVPLVKKCPSMTANDIRSAMYGLQGMHSSSKEGHPTAHCSSLSAVLFHKSYHLSSFLPKYEFIIHFPQSNHFFLVNYLTYLFLFIRYL